MHFVSASEKASALFSTIWINTDAEKGWSLRPFSTSPISVCNSNYLLSSHNTWNVIKDLRMEAFGKIGVEHKGFHNAEHEDKAML